MMTYLYQLLKSTRVQYCAEYLLMSWKRSHCNRPPTFHCNTGSIRKRPPAERSSDHRIGQSMLILICVCKLHKYLPSKQFKTLKLLEHSPKNRYQKSQLLLSATKTKSTTHCFSQSIKEHLFVSRTRTYEANNEGPASDQSTNQTNDEQ